jgi:hypothetical protein
VHFLKKVRSELGFAGPATPKYRSVHSTRYISETLHGGNVFPDCPTMPALASFPCLGRCLSICRGVPARSRGYP